MARAGSASCRGGEEVRGGRGDVAASGLACWVHDAGKRHIRGCGERHGGEITNDEGSLLDPPTRASACCTPVHAKATRSARATHPRYPILKSNSKQFQARFPDYQGSLSLLDYTPWRLSVKASRFLHASSNKLGCAQSYRLERRKLKSPLSTLGPDRRS